MDNLKLFVHFLNIPLPCVNSKFIPVWSSLVKSTGQLRIVYRLYIRILLSNSIKISPASLAPLFSIKNRKKLTSSQSQQARAKRPDGAIESGGEILNFGQEKKMKKKFKNFTGSIFLRGIQNSNKNI